ncbi:hypothetical protein THAOC_31009 [Thalassiosira oceanica]|uniref:Uncharacterized protein n=1 Tax=Thalassiosira oceanica TaxID=159749 RepID=K0R920_THAOC|nr:hypothetical protein THAOC_31009 [Thalassiosira oceanica]|eukprot:EJK50058.1 hypothetical protein THAOC_31009 [Thalassiosira oceanica]
MDKLSPDFALFQGFQGDRKIDRAFQERHERKGQRALGHVGQQPIDGYGTTMRQAPRALEIFFPDYPENDEPDLADMMGKEQLKWLKQGHKDSTTTWKRSSLSLATTLLELWMVTRIALGRYKRSQPSKCLAGHIYVAKLARASKDRR